MADLASFHMVFLAGAALIGLLSGWIAVVHRGAVLQGAALQLAIAAIAIMLALSFSHFLPGRAGYWLDLALVMLAAYLPGCLVGSWLRRWVLARSHQR